MTKPDESGQYAALIDAEHASALASIRAARGAAPYSSPHIQLCLLVENETLFARVIERWVKEHSIITAVHYAASLETARKFITAEPHNHYRVAIVDYYLANGLATTFISQLRNTIPDLYIILISGDGSDEWARELGANEFLGKPFDGLQLKTVLHRALA